MLCIDVSFALCITYWGAILFLCVASLLTLDHFKGKLRRTCSTCAANAPQAGPHGFAQQVVTGPDLVFLPLPPDAAMQAAMDPIHLPLAPLALYLDHTTVEAGGAIVTAWAPPSPRGQPYSPPRHRCPRHTPWNSRNSRSSSSCSSIGSIMGGSHARSSGSRTRSGRDRAMPAGALVPDCMMHTGGAVTVTARPAAPLASPSSDCRISCAAPPAAGACHTAAMSVGSACGRTASSLVSLPRCCSRSCCGFLQDARTTGRDRTAATDAVAAGRAALAATSSRTAAAAASAASGRFRGAQVVGSTAGAVAPTARPKPQTPGSMNGHACWPVTRRDGAGSTSAPGATACSSSRPYLPPARCRTPCHASRTTAPCGGSGGRSGSRASSEGPDEAPCGHMVGNWVGGEGPTCSSVARTGRGSVLGVLHGPGACGDLGVDSGRGRGQHMRGAVPLHCVPATGRSPAAAPTSELCHSVAMARAAASGRSTAVTADSRSSRPSCNAAGGSPRSRVPGSDAGDRGLRSSSPSVPIAVVRGDGEARAASPRSRCVRSTDVPGGPTSASDSASGRQGHRAGGVTQARLDTDGAALPGLSDKSMGSEGSSDCDDVRAPCTPATAMTCGCSPASSPEGSEASSTAGSSSSSPWPSPRTSSSSGGAAEGSGEDGKAAVRSSGGGAADGTAAAAAAGMAAVQLGAAAAVTHAMPVMAARRR